MKIDSLGNVLCDCGKVASLIEFKDNITYYRGFEGIRIYYCNKCDKDFFYDEKGVFHVVS